MTDIEPKQGYPQHRDNQVERILEAAEMLFIREGIDHVSMRDIAGGARMSRKTLYQYFSDKQAIAWAIYQRLVEEWESHAPVQHNGNGYQQLERYMHWVMHELGANREHQRFFVEFNALYTREAGEDRTSKMMSPSGSVATTWVTQMLRKGIDDGSIRAEIEPEIVSYAFMNLLIGMNARFALMDELIAEDYGLPSLDIYQEICRIFLKGIRT